jgi:DNA ligase-associated metallophosphoesterase
VLEIEVAGQRLLLLAQRAAFLPGHGVLLIADAHLGKALSFRRLGVPVPAGTTAEMLATLSALMRSTLARRVVFLGDLLHSARSRSPDSWAAVAEWRQGHADVEMTLVRGNHDRHAGDPPPDWHIDAVDEPLRCGPLALAHHPDPVEGAYVLAGHVHPAAVLGGKAHDRLRLPCFHLGPDVGVLPAFGGFTGMHVLPRGPDDRVYVIAGDSVRPLHSLP